MSDHEHHEHHHEEQHGDSFDKEETTEVSSHTHTSHDPETEQDTASGGPADPPSDDA
ncbi:hypothetical protein AA0Z99_06620 [Agrococcus sp. 1P02AA]|uniref:hypothetical protein n=1 Tax=Agrococcus sp. 1P02AA TaxID=3132259 RepID=UPI0039A70EA2